MVSFGQVVVTDSGQTGFIGVGRSSSDLAEYCAEIGDHVKFGRAGLETNIST